MHHYPAPDLPEWVPQPVPQPVLAAELMSAVPMTKSHQGTGCTLEDLQCLAQQLNDAGADGHDRFSDVARRQAGCHLLAVYQMTAAMTALEHVAQQQAQAVPIQGTASPCLHVLRLTALKGALCHW